MTQLTLMEKAAKHWTPDRIRKLTGGKKLLIDPLHGAQLLRSLGLLNTDASMPADCVRKYLQINHMVAQLSKSILQLSERFDEVRILDCGCGNSYLTFLLAWCLKNSWHKTAKITGIDARADVIERASQRARELGLQDFLHFEKTTVQDFSVEREKRLTIEERKVNRYHLVVALHACDTATDDSIAFAFVEKADVVAVAPCCQAELANKWRQLAAEQFKSALSVLINSPELRRDSCSTFTDAMRVLLLRGQGYEVTTTEFVPSNHTPKNRLILAHRRGNYQEAAIREYVELRNALGAGITLDQQLTDEAAEILRKSSAQT